MFQFKYIWFTALCIQLFHSSCSTQPPAQLHGKIALHEGWAPVVFLVQPLDFSQIACNYSGKVLDSVRVAPDGSFVLKQPANLEASMGIFELVVQPVGYRYPTRLNDENPAAANYMPFVWKAGQSLDIESDIAHIQQHFSIKQPDADNSAMLHLRDMRQQSYAAQSPMLSSEQHDENTLLAREDALQRFRAPMMAFADSTKSLPAALVAINWVCPKSDYERLPEFLTRQCEKWQKTAPEQPFVRQLCSIGNPDKLPIQTGQVIPDFPLPMVSGDTVLLHNLLGKRLTIVDIWASWCGPCRRENRETLVPLWREYRDRGLQIVGYSIDGNAAAWKAAIAKDEAAWPHASHLTGDSTPFMDALRISTIPANFIVDANGKVLAKNLHGEALTAWVHNYLQ